MMERDLSETAFTNEDNESARDFVVCSVNASGIPKSQILTEAYETSPEARLMAKEKFFWLGIVVSSLYFISVLLGGF